MNNKENAKQALIGFTEFAKGITGNQNLKIPDDIAKRYGINTDSEQESYEMTAKEDDNVRNSRLAIEAQQKVFNSYNHSYNDEDIATAFQIGIMFGKADKAIEEVKKSITPQQKMGRWILQPSNKEQGERDFIWWKCSECGQVIYSETEQDRRKYHAYCGMCGCKMQ